MTRNIRLTIEYDGARFCGWQAQKCTSAPHTTRVRGRQEHKCISKIKTIQEEIEKAGEKLFGKKISLIGAGRTDSGVRAEAQTANFKIDSNLPLKNIKKGLNSYLPDDIAILSAEEAGLNFHARFDAKEKLYRYTILNRKVRSPLLKTHAALVSYDLDLAAMRKAAGFLVGKKDFKSFQASPGRQSKIAFGASDKKETGSVRTVSEARIVSRPPLVEIYIQADGFLYNMVRNIAGTLIDVGRGRLSVEDFRDILNKRHRPLAGQTALAKGLCLVKVFY